VPQKPFVPQPEFQFEAL
jgi:hypothetical protein